jgi:ribonucleotide monophosphatase NagD (HAD superfamily)
MFVNRADTDILLGKNCGLQTLLVGSGVHNLDKVPTLLTSVVLIRISQSGFGLAES